MDPALFQISTYYGPRDGGFTVRRHNHLQMKTKNCYKQMVKRRLYQSRQYQKSCYFLG